MTSFGVEANLPLDGRVRVLIRAAAATYAGHPGATSELRKLAARMDEPLRVAVAGRVKSGKSTLLNALVGEPLAATESGECTRFVTWYRQGLVYRTRIQLRSGKIVTVPFHRDQACVEPDLAGYDPADIDRLIIEWPAPLLQAMSLIDTPGLGSLTPSLGERTLSFLLPGDEISPADAVVYLARHLHAADVRFLEAFHDDDAGRPDPINAVTVLARADEVGAGRLGAMETAARVAYRYRRDPQVRRLSQTVVPVAGLLALGASLLTEDDFRSLARLSQADDEAVEAILLSTDRFGRLDVDVGISLETRAGLLDRYGLFGVRLACSLVRSGAVASADALARELRRRSGIDELRNVLSSQFVTRAAVLKSRAALAALDRLIQRVPPEDRGRLARLVEEVAAGAHELAEHRLFLALREGVLDLAPHEATEVERLVTQAGRPTAERLGLDGAAGQDVLRQEILTRVRRWQRRAEHPLAPVPIVDAARLMTRSYAGMLADVG